jgi:hypothetical protein
MMEISKLITNMFSLILYFYRTTRWFSPGTSVTAKIAPTEYQLPEQ